MHEVAQLQRDLRRAEIEPFAWVINNSLSPLNVTDSLLAECQRHEAKYVLEVVTDQTSRTTLIAWQREPSVGSEALKRAMQSEMMMAWPGIHETRLQINPNTQKRSPIMNDNPLFPDIQSYVTSRTNEFDQISVERRAELQQLAVYVGTCIARGQDAKLTFVCTHNSRRSHLTQIWTQIAAAHYGVNHVQTFSGGTEATACNPRTVAALKRCGLRFSVLKEDGSNPHYSVTFSDHEPPLICYSKVFNKAPNPTSNYCAIMTCSHADQNCPVAIGCDERLAIRYEDPKVSDATPQEAATYDERCAQIAREMLYAMSRVKG